MPTDAGVVADLEALVEAIEAASFRLPFDDRKERDRARRALAVGIRRFVVPRVTDDDAPVVALLTGLTGTGKSTLLNSLAERRLSVASPLRPTTTEVIIWAHRRHAGRYWQEFVAQVEERIGPSADIVVGDEPLLDYLTLIDAPPLDVSRAGDLLALADLAVFVTSATRYADSQAWDILDLIRGRGLPILFVINRLPRDPTSSQSVVEDFASKLFDAGFLGRPDSALLFTVYEHRIDVSTDGLPPGSVAGLKKELGELGDASFRAKIADAARRSLFADLGRRADRVAALAADETRKGRELLAMGERSYNARIAAIDSDLEAGRYAALANESDPAPLGKLLARHVAIGAQDTAALWSQDPIGRRLVQGQGRPLWTGSEEAEDDTTTAVRRWIELVEKLAAQRTRRGRMLPRRRRKVGRLLRASALMGADAAVPEPLVKRYGQQGAVGVIRAARGALLDALGPAFQADAGRFRAAVGPIERLEVLVGLLEERSRVFGGDR